METLNAKVVNSVREEEAENEKNSALDALIDLLLFELNVPSYKFLGPGMKLAERLKRGQVGVNPLDEFSRLHDEENARKNGNSAFLRMLAGDTPGYERTLAMMTACCMIRKITFEKFFSPIFKAIRGQEDKKQKEKALKAKKRKGKKREC